MAHAITDLVLYEIKNAAPVVSAVPNAAPVVNVCHMLPQELMLFQMLSLLEHAAPQPTPAEQLKVLNITF